MLSDNEVITRDILKEELRSFLGELKVYLDGRFDEFHVYVDKRFDGLDKEIKGINNRLDFTNRRIDNHLLDCVRQEQHYRLEKRVLKLEKA